MTATLKDPFINKLFIFLSVVFIVMFIGVGAAFAPVQLAIFSLVPIFFILACWQFRIAVLVMLVLACGLIPKALTPTIPLLGGRVRAEDMFLIMLVIIGAFRLIVRADRFKSSPLWYPLYYFAVLVVFSLLIAFFNHNKLKYIMFETRTIFYWFYVALLFISIKCEKHLRTTLNLIIILSTLVAAVAVFQSLTGIQILTDARFSPLITGADVNRNINRSFLGGFQAFVVFSFVLMLVRLVRREISPYIALPVLLMIALGLIATFGRGVWAATFVVVFIASVWLGWRSFVRIWAVLFFIASMIASISFLIVPELLDAIVSRTMSVSDEVQKGESWDWRVIEIEHGIKTIKKHPIRGIGLGGEYMPVLNKNMAEEQTAMSHNSYLYIALKFGLLGLLFPAWLAVVVLLKTKQIGDTLSIAIGSAFMNPVLIGYTQMEWAQMFGVLFMATMVGLLATHDRLKNTLKEPKSIG
ncbi:MAG: O-antigen ligase family protein [Dehalococcoidia bacterium]|nr:O-antigen ligase family protein [Dehalococcoidia bacterium]